MPTLTRLVCVLIAMGLSACESSYGYGIARPHADLVVESAGPVQYSYRIVRHTTLPERAAATPWISGPPVGSREIAAIYVARVSPFYGRRAEPEFHRLLGTLAGELGGTHFGIVRVDRDHDGLIRGLVASVTLSSRRDLEGVVAHKRSRRTCAP